MRRVNNVIKTTKRDGSIEKIVSKLPDSPADYSAIFASVDKKLIDKGIQSLSECDEDFHPAMLIPTAFFFKKTPAKALADFDTRFDDGSSFFEIFIENFFSQVQQWILLNTPLLQEIIELCGGEVTPDTEIVITVLNSLHITPEIEDKFVALAKTNDRQNRLKRIKFLAAVNLLFVFSSYNHAVQKGDNLAASFFMFFMARSMAQFAANKAVEDGLEAQEKTRKGGEHIVDREGLLTIIRDFKNKYPESDARGLWKIIHNFLIKNKKYKLVSGHSVRFEIEPTDTEDTGGRLIQTNPDKKTYSMQFQAFRKAFTEIRN